ncbi:MAG: electron transfer flavoprotein subunit beta/FixA family protein [Cyanobacteriota bacterium]
MKIVVCIKQVPDTADIKWTENNTMMREGVESIMNPFDEYGVETAIRLKESMGGEAHITVMTMGPPQAKDALKKALAMGCDSAMLISDKKFAAADTWATSKTVSQAIKDKISDFDLIICGQFAIDGDTGQVGPSVAEALEIPQVTYCKELAYNKDNNTIIATKAIESGIIKRELQLPGLVCMLKCDYSPRMPNIKGVMRANKTDIPAYGMADLNLELDEVGLKGSPTFVAKSYRQPPRTQGELINQGDTKANVNLLIEKLRDKKVILQ